MTMVVPRSPLPHLAPSRLPRMARRSLQCLACCRTERLRPAQRTALNAARRRCLCMTAKLRSVQSVRSCCVLENCRSTWSRRWRDSPICTSARIHHTRISPQYRAHPSLFCCQCTLSARASLQSSPRSPPTMHTILTDTRSQPTFTRCCSLVAPEGTSCSTLTRRSC
ncbi:hypothetical protein AOLI_G00113180, partial [Acnodon oligacanthus]